MSESIVIGSLPHKIPGHRAHDGVLRRHDDRDLPHLLTGLRAVGDVAEQILAARVVANLCEEPRQVGALRKAEDGASGDDGKLLEGASAGALPETRAPGHVERN